MLSLQANTWLFHAELHKPLRVCWCSAVAKRLNYKSGSPNFKSSNEHIHEMPICIILSVLASQQYKAHRQYYSLMGCHINCNKIVYILLLLPLSHSSSRSSPESTIVGWPGLPCHNCSPFYQAPDPCSLPPSFPLPILEQERKHKIGPIWQKSFGCLFPSMFNDPSLHFPFLLPFILRLSPIIQ